jgi:hypothetical protein
MADEPKTPKRDLWQEMIDESIRRVRKMPKREAD